MATVTPVTAFVSSVTGVSVVSDAFTPSAGDLLVVAVLGRRTSANGALVGSTGLTFTRVAQNVIDGNGFYLFVANAFATNVSQTLTFSCPGDFATDFYIKICRVSGMTKTALAAVRQYKYAVGGSTLEATLAAAILTGNPAIVFGGVTDHPTGLTSEPTGFSTLEDTEVDSGSLGAAFAYVSSGVTDTTLSFGGTPADDSGMYAVELDASAAAGARSFAACAG